MHPTRQVPSELASSPSSRVVRQLYYDISSPHQPHQGNASLVALGEAPFLHHRVANTSFLICAEDFFEDNPLIAATLQPRTRQKYAVALENFRISSFASLPYALPLDHRLCMYIQDAYTRKSSPGNRQEMASLLCMILIMYPSLRGANLGLSKRFLSGWRSLQPSKSSAPFTKEITLALAWHMVAQGNCEAAITVLSTFAVCLRVSEALSIEIQDIAFPGDTRIAGYGPHAAGLNIRDAKTSRYTGRLQFVKLDDPQTIKILQAWTRATNRQTGRLVTLSYEQYSSNLKRALSSIDLQNAQFTSHSARIGKATQDYIEGIPVDQIAINGRWKSINSLRYYVTNGRSWLLDTHIPPPHRIEYPRPQAA